ADTVARDRSGPWVFHRTATQHGLTSPVSEAIAPFGLTWFTPLLEVMRFPRRVVGVLGHPAAPGQARRTARPGHRNRTGPFREDHPMRPNVLPLRSASEGPWRQRRARRIGTPGPSSWLRQGARPAMLIVRARVEPVTRGPVPVANGPSSARSWRPAT